MKSTFQLKQDLFWMMNSRIMRLNEIADSLGRKNYNSYTKLLIKADNNTTDEILKRFEII